MWHIAALFEWVIRSGKSSLTQSNPNITPPSSGRGYIVLSNVEVLESLGSGINPTVCFRTLDSWVHFV
jgi:hypothetical protein